jgi:predicted RNA-binding protein with PIN domain
MPAAVKADRNTAPIKGAATKAKTIKDKGQSMIIIIDGYNLLPNLNIKGSSFEQKRDNMIAQLLEFIAVNPASVTLVFDGTRNPSMHRGNENHSGIRVIFSANGETADDVIEELIANRKGKARDYLIVSSDRRLQTFAEEHSMKWMTSQKFGEYFE